MKGVYILIISVAEDIRINVGSLGEVFFEKGSYTYVGSAQKSLEKRIERHRRKAKRKFWHIDYLLDNRCANVVDVLYKAAEKSEECKIARKLSERVAPIVDFGSSDCSCVSHLFKIDNCSFMKDFASEMQLQSWFLCH